VPAHRRTKTIRGAGRFGDQNIIGGRGRCAIEVQNGLIERNSLRKGGSAVKFTPGITPENVALLDRVEELWRDGSLSMLAIGEKVGVSRSHVSRLIARERQRSWRLSLPRPSREREFPAVRRPSAR
jgi:hypothetical protein